MAKTDVVVIGAGVAGLTTALLLSRDPRYRIVVAAKHMPGDYDIDYASPWAGANYMPVGRRGTLAAQYERDTWKPLEDLARNHPEAGVHFQECEIRRRDKDVGIATADWFAELISPDPWFKDVVPNFRTLPGVTLPPGIDAATAFTSVCINTAIYLPYLLSQCLRNRVTFRRAVFAHILDAANPSLFASSSRPKPPIILNCTGLGSRTLGGVADNALTAARGQIVLVRNTVTAGSDPAVGRMINISGTDDGGDEACYIMARAAGGGTVLGGCYQLGRTDGLADEGLARRIMERCVQACPELVARAGEKGSVEDLDVIRHGVGLRPVRQGGTRVEKEMIGGVWVVHNYGAGGAGYQNSYGCAMAAVKLVGEVAGDVANL